MSKSIFGRLNDEFAARDKAAGLTMADVLGLPDTERSLIQWMLRNGELELAQAAAITKSDEAAVHIALQTLVEQGFVREMHAQGATRYAVRFSPRRTSRVSSSVWVALGDKLTGEGETS